ncbi:G-type lectin S-receptor-like serine/threonine-protein kinase At2g19130 [Dioscorea cayenensis subsp. rotundata]|uniref:G-type lectin S-receptor-like serine/threonine-protein kinase At2g19130 n=1 Tax=Dioscorea cayennensis subsp. rotundata TaxID=55577 RepID=A0AB40CMN5_DIOCR|nr:G-type lectin S-receptor-like serine/threonine-protein kinase At2g19130 [Dioscorea cayenensis subsp. rotundata]
MTPRSTFLAFMLSIVSLAICSSHGSDSITSNQSLSGDQKLLSVGGNFVLGFFTKNKTSSKFYIGIWYKRVSELTPVWVANRATPVSDITKSLLHISKDGNLALLDQSINSPVWSTNATIPSNSSTVAVLQDNGNLVLRDAVDSANIFWQSFDNPTHMWLPGIKINFNKITKVSRRIISWKNSEDPALGLFSNSNLEDTQNVLQWNMSKIYWTSGPWNGRIFINLPEMTSQYLFKLTFVNTSEESYFTFSLLDNTTTPYVAYVMDVSGQMKAVLWVETAQQWTQIFAAPAQCEVTNFCGPFGSCNEQSQQHCSCVKGFSQRSPKDWALRDYSGGCVRDTPLQSCNGTSSDYAGEGDKFSHMSNVRLPNDGRTMQVGNDDECLQRATKNFSDKLGAGSFGSVSKGALPDSTAIAVKKLEGLRQGEKQFRAEVSTLGTIQHVNLVRFRGFCAEGKERLLVFYYMPNGSLDSHLFHGNDSVLDWSTRYRIALGIARGLEYLHEKCRECIIHCDIKPENILLDVEFNPKIADFGLAKLLGREFSHVLTSMRGTIGYLAPEWITGLAITPRADVYSFGMMLLEIISGKRNTEQLEESGNYYFPAVAAVKVTEDTVQCLLDDRLQGNANMDELIIACRVACWCIQGLESQRPTMGLVVRMLEGLMEVSIPPIPSIFRALVIN